MVVTCRLGVIGVCKAFVLPSRHEADLLHEACCRVRIEETNAMAWAAQLLAGVIHVASRHESERHQERLDVTRELLTSRGPIGVAVVRVTVRLEETAYERRVYIC